MSGFVDVHSHVVPAGDDGAATIEQGLELCRLALEAGTEILFAPRPFWLSERAAAQLAERGGCHDLPYAPAHFEAGDPVCSVSASGSDPEQVLELLTGRREALRSSLELQQ